MVWLEKARKDCIFMLLSLFLSFIRDSTAECCIYCIIKSYIYLVLRCERVEGHVAVERKSIIGTCCVC